MPLSNIEPTGGPGSSSLGLFPRQGYIALYVLLAMIETALPPPHLSGVTIFLSAVSTTKIASSFAGAVSEALWLTW